MEYFLYHIVPGIVTGLIVGLALYLIELKRQRDQSDQIIIDNLLSDTIHIDHFDKVNAHLPNQPGILLLGFGYQKRLWLIHVENTSDLVAFAYGPLMSEWACPCIYSFLSNLPLKKPESANFRFSYQIIHFPRQRKRITTKLIKIFKPVCNMSPSTVFNADEMYPALWRCQSPV